MGGIANANKLLYPGLTVFARSVRNGCVAGPGRWACLPPPAIDRIADGVYKARNRIARI
jgi:hypothetical protein